jgi:hypothetical protein
MRWKGPGRTVRRCHPGALRYDWEGTLATEPTMRPIQLAPMLLLLGFDPSAAATLTWPGAAPCDGTLQSCIAAAAAGDTVRIARNAPVDESLLINKSLHLQPASGWSPILSRSLELQIPNLAPGASTVITIEGLTLEEAGISVMHAASSPGQVRLRGNTIRSVPLAGSWFNGSAVRITTASPSYLELEVVDNLIDARLLAPGDSGHAGLRIAGEGSGHLSGFIARNRILMRGAPTLAAIEVTREAGPSDFRIGLNRIEGSRFGDGIRFHASGGTASHFLGIYNNVVVGQQHASSGAGVTLANSTAEVLAQVLSNTVTYGQRGLLISGAVDVQLANNLFAYNGEDVLIAGESTVSFLHNLSHGNASTRLAGTTGLVTGSPRLAFDGFRIRPGSAAADAGNADIGMSHMELVDIDGLPRYKGAAIDIGAHESGASHVLHRALASNTTGYMSSMAELRDMPAANPQLTQNWNPGGGVSGVYNNHPVGIYRVGGRWTIFNEDLAPIPMSASFNVFAPGSAPAGHLSAAANTFDGASQINRDDLDERPDAFLLATHDWNGHGSPGRYMTTRWGVAFLGSRWSLIDLEAPFPYDRAFNLHIQTPSRSAFLHTASIDNVLHNWTTIDHPALNGRACALLQVTPRTDGGAAASQQLGVWYTGTRWAVFQQGMAGMPIGLQMHVLFDPAQVESCSRESIYRDGMEAVPFRAN